MSTKYFEISIAYSFYNINEGDLSISTRSWIVALVVKKEVLSNR
jgi:hypothetical protein